MIRSENLQYRVATGAKSSLSYFARPISLARAYDKSNLKPDLVAGLTVAVILLPQAIAYALMAGMPPESGLYTAVIAAIVAGLWGSSKQLHSGPTNTASVLVLTTLLPIAAAGSPKYLAAAGLLAIMVGIFRLVLGIAHLGMLVNFVSDSVIIGFTAGAGVLIWVNQIGNLFRLTLPNNASMIATLQNLVGQVPFIHWPSFVLGIVIGVLIVIVRRVNGKLPGALIALVLAATIVWIFNLENYGIKVIGVVKIGIPRLADLSQFNFDLIYQLSSGALAIGAIGLVEAMSIAKSIATQTGQRIDSNQEFVGQGLSNIASGIFSGFPGSGSFSRSAVNLNAGARTQFSSVFSGLFVLIAAILLGPLTAYVPRAAVAGILVVIAYGMIDTKEIARILHGAPGDVFIMVVTFVSTLLLSLQFAVLIGILASFAVYILRTSIPRVVCVLPDDNFKHLIYQPQKPNCPQLAIFKILGDLYFGAVTNVEKVIHDHLAKHPHERFLLLSMESVNQCDISGIHFLESILRLCQERGGEVYFQRVQDSVLNLMQSSGFLKQLGEDHILSEDQAINYIFYRVLDPAVCVYECEFHVFLECQNIPKQIAPIQHVPSYVLLPSGSVVEISPEKLWSDLHSAAPPVVIDVREPREYQRGHIVQAQSIPVNQLLNDLSCLPKDRPIVLVCRSGRRSSRACYALHNYGIQAKILQGGMLAWENAGLFEAIEDWG